MAQRRRWLVGGRHVTASLDEVRQVHLAPDQFVVVTAHVRLGDAAMRESGVQPTGLFEAHATCIAKASAERGAFAVAHAGGRSAVRHGVLRRSGPQPLAS